MNENKLQELYELKWMFGDWERVSFMLYDKVKEKNKQIEKKDQLIKEAKTLIEEMAKYIQSATPCGSLWEEDLAFRVNFLQVKLEDNDGIY